MNKTKPLFIADSCVGGLSVVKSIWGSACVSEVKFLADYVINPLGVKSDSAIAGVVKRWLSLAEEHSDTLILACNTLSIRYHQLFAKQNPETSLSHIISMVDCFEAMVKAEAAQLTGKKVLVIGTEFTAGQSVYPDLLKQQVSGVEVETIAATDLERKIARFENRQGEPLLNAVLQRTISHADIAVLACTCFPMVKDALCSLFPGVTFLDPGVYCSELLPATDERQNRQLAIKVTGELVTPQRVKEFAESYLDGTVRIST
jgi:glutamate racemase